MLLSMETVDIPLFPLYTVVYPGTRLPLKIFEPRYLKMISDCVRNDMEFGICLIAEGKEVGPAAQPNPDGTAARVVDFNQDADGILHIMAEGTRRFHLNEYAVTSDQGLRGTITWATDSNEVYPDDYRYLARTLKDILERIEMANPKFRTQYDNPHWVSYRLAELLPVPLVAKQQLLSMDNAKARLQVIARWTAELDLH